MTSHVKRIKPQFQRDIKPYRDAFLVLVATEGEKTEELYFSFPFVSHRRVKVLPIPSKDGCSAPAYVLENLKATAKKLDLGKHDKLWLAIDKDRWKDQQIREVMGQKIRKMPIQVAVSNPCFELWLFLHFAPLPSSPINCSKAMGKELRKVKRTYRKNSLKPEEYESGFPHAMKEAGKTKVDKEGVPTNPGTHVYLIMEEIQKLKTNERYQYPRASPGLRRRCLLFRPKGRGITPCFPGTRSGEKPSC
ncbi:RloB domain-containing protein [Sphaerochaeta halotolerans]|jgi:hypothetical protein|uniref:RloB domain-containing protein n=1 Tax=Sphaerochaeta halotolerans TaxID=2293840 RepID=A0A372MEA9_9SPIR|nr:RloB family protein [Sphaerochaeta halotolerans]MDN5334686.1 hypothetical protein [Sphaerochaeta sp.]RFU94094.1 RloB domain-containing protein [Sphaerochaeta halotolerans]